MVRHLGFRVEVREQYGSGERGEGHSTQNLVEARSRRDLERGGRNIQGSVWSDPWRKNIKRSV